MNPTTALYNFLLAQLSPDELRRWLSEFPGAKTLLSELPGGSVNPAQFTWDATDLLNRHGILRYDDTWDRLLAIRPNFKPEIDAIKRNFLPNGRPTQLPGGDTITTPTAPVTTPPPPPTNRLKILLVSACPDDQDRVRTDREFRDIITKLESHSSSVQIEQIHAATFGLLRRALLMHKPHVLHIGCHATPNGDLLLESEQGGTDKIARQRIVDLLKPLKGNLRLVFLNGCDTDHLAREIPPAIDLAIGMRKPITDKSAIDLSVAFYESLAFSMTVGAAFDIALASLSAETGTPELFPPADDNPDNKRNQTLIPP